MSNFVQCHHEQRSLADVIPVKRPILVGVKVHLPRSSFLAGIEGMREGMSTPVKVKIVPVGAVAKANFDLTRAERSSFD